MEETVTISLERYDNFKKSEAEFVKYKEEKKAELDILGYNIAQMHKSGIKMLFNQQPINSKEDLLLLLKNRFDVYIHSNLPEEGFTIVFKK